MSFSEQKSCQHDMGIGRSALVAACLPKSQGIGVDEAFAMISRARGFSVPDTEEQREWASGFAELRRGEGPP
jgi:protein-tyrosine phosphatase